MLLTGELVLFTLFPRGKAVLEEHRASVMNAIRETIRQLSDEDLRDVSNTLRRLQDTLSKLHYGKPAGTSINLQVYVV